MRRFTQATALSFALSLTLSPSAKAHDYAPVFLPRDGQSIKDVEGSAVAFSVLPHGTVAVSVLPVAEHNSGKVTLVISIANQTASDALIDPDTISATLTAGLPVKIITTDDLIRKVEDDAAEPSVVVSSSNGPLEGRSSPVAVAIAGHSALRMYDSHPAPPIVQKTASEQAGEERSRQDYKAVAIGNIRSTVLQKTTVLPGKIASGTFLLQVPRLKSKDDRTMTVTVPFAGDEHVFVLRMDKSGAF